MTAPFEIEIEPERRLLRMTTHGQWGEADFDAFADAYRQAVSAMNATGGIAYSLVDARDYAVLTTDMAARFPTLIAETNVPLSRRTAIVMPAMINRVRSRDVGELFNARYFRTIEDAADWLFSDEA